MEESELHDMRSQRSSAVSACSYALNASLCSARASHRGALRGSTLAFLHLLPTPDVEPRLLPAGYSVGEGNTIHFQLRIEGFVCDVLSSLLNDDLKSITIK